MVRDGQILSSRPIGSSNGAPGGWLVPYGDHPKNGGNEERELFSTSQTADSINVSSVGTLSRLGQAFADAIKRFYLGLSHVTVEGNNLTACRNDGRGCFDLSDGRFDQGDMNGLGGAIELGILATPLGVEGESISVASRVTRPVAAEAEVAAARGGGNIVYRAATGTPRSMTPRPSDTSGLSAANSLENALP